MTEKEAECFLAMKRWQRKCLQRQMFACFSPPIFMHSLFRQAHLVGKSIVLIVNLLLLPLLLVWWCLRILKGLLFFPLLILFTYTKPTKLRGPGERNIKGLHYQFASDIEFPLDVYIECVNEWTTLLYGSDKLPEYGLENYLGDDYLQRSKEGVAKDELLSQIMKTQISNAREELSRDLGHY